MRRFEARYEPRQLPETTARDRERGVSAPNSDNSSKASQAATATSPAREAKH